MYLDTCTLKQACDWIIEHKKPTLPFDTYDDLPDDCTETAYKKHLETAKKRILKAVYNKNITVKARNYTGDYINITNTLVKYPYAILDIERNAILCPNEPEPLDTRSVRRYDYMFEDIQIPFADLKRCFKKPLISQSVLSNYKMPDFPDNVRISEYMQIAFELLKEGYITTEKVTLKNVLKKKIKAKLEAYNLETSERTVDAIATIIRPVESRTGSTFQYKKK